MKRYLVFAGECYYPGGGASDFVDDFDTIKDAMACHCSHTDWDHILDTELGQIHEFDDNKWSIKPIKEWII